MTGYAPIDCGVHSRLELAIMHGDMLEMSWRPTGRSQRTDIVKPVDLITRNHEEFLVVIADEEPAEIRLDQIIDFMPAHPTKRINK